MTSNQKKVRKHIRSNSRFYHAAMGAIHECRTLKAATNRFMRKYGYYRLPDGSLLTRLSVYRALLPVWEEVKGSQPV